jgi:hypothetical protein
MLGLHMFLLWLCGNEPTCLTYLTFLRFIAAFDTRRFSLVAFEACTLAAWTFAVLGKDARPMFSMLLFGHLACFFASLSCALALDSVQRLITIDSDAQLFLDHALKQKFAGTASAIEVALDLPEVDWGENNTQLLAHTLKECRVGYDRCLLAGITSKLRKDGARDMNRGEGMTLAEITTRWSRLLGVNVRRGGGGNAAFEWVQGDFELMRLIVSCTSLHGQLLGVCVDLLDDRLVVKPHPPASIVLTQHVFAKLALDHLKGAWDVKDLRFVFPVVVVSQQPTRSPPPVFPSGLTFGVLDDSLLSRKALMKVILGHLDGSPRSVQMGMTAREVGLFIEHVVANEFDVVLLDHHLNYESGEVLGTDVAQTLRERGFRGKIVLHTADSHVEVGAEVDAVMEKTLSRHVLRERLLMMMVT